MSMVKLICYNIEYCEGMEGLWYQYLMVWRIFFPPRNIDQNIVEALKSLSPDILALIEVDTGSFRSKKDEVIYFEEKLGLKHYVEAVKYPWLGWMKLFHHVPILQKQANAIITKYNITDVKYHLFHEGTKRVVIETTIHCPKKATLLLAHLSLKQKTRECQLRELIDIVNKIKNPVILMGDFNTFNGEQEIQGLLNASHLKDYARLDHESLHLTQPSWHPTRRLDYILFSSGIKVDKYKVLNFPFSDHMPLYVEFNMK
jgi:endonuclease/exonuclease/phosphatase family metal-dependent hydrolase